MSVTPTIVFAGGGTGGHIFPSLAILERLRRQQPDLAALFLISNRPLDRQILSKQEVACQALPAEPWSWNPIRWPEFFQAYKQSVSLASNLLAQVNAKVLVAMGGYVSAPAAAAAREARIPCALVNLDAVPGKANRRLAGQANQVFSVYPTPVLPSATPIGLPLRRSSIGPADKAVARQMLGLDPQRETIFVTGASQGAQSLNRMMIELSTHTQVRKALADWQILHQSGDKDVEALEEAYAKAGWTAKVLPFCDPMGPAWACATIAISRCGAGSVAEVWANAVPTLFFPYPYHKDQHQKLNAEPLTHAGAAILMTDHIDPLANAKHLGPRLLALMKNDTHRYQMADQMRRNQPPDGAAVVADWIMSQCST